MKNYLSISFLFIASLLFANTMSAQSRDNDDPVDNWPQEVAFHAVMSSVFHPAQEGDLDPVKKRSEELVKIAYGWMESAPPAEYNKPEITAKLRLLYKESTELNKVVKSGAKDDEIRVMLSKLHDVFHEIVGLCTKDVTKKAERKKR